MADALRSFTRQEIVACGSRSPERADAFAARFGIPRAYGSYEELVADPQVQAVYVASPHSEHADHARLALEAGKHVLVEKAFTQNAAQARDLVALARDRRLTLMEAMWTRFLPRHDIVRQLVEDGALGEIEAVYADHGQAMVFRPEGRMFNPDLAGGALLDLGIYPVSFASFVLGRPGAVHARGTLTATGVDQQDSIILDGYPTAAAHAVLTTTLAARTPTTGVIAGTRARIELEGPFYAPGVVRVVEADRSCVTSAPPRITGHLGLCHEAAHFASLVHEGQLELPLMPLDESVALMETLDEIRRQVGVNYPGE